MAYVGQCSRCQGLREKTRLLIRLRPPRRRIFSHRSLLERASAPLAAPPRQTLNTIRVLIVAPPARMACHAFSGNGSARESQPIPCLLQVSVERVSIHSSARQLVQLGSTRILAFGNTNVTAVHSLCLLVPLSSIWQGFRHGSKLHLYLCLFDIDE